MTQIKTPRIIRPVEPANAGNAGGEDSEPLTSAEQGKLWATCVGNSVGVCVLSHMAQHVEDPEIRQVLEEALALADRLERTVRELFARENYPAPQGFSVQEDVDQDAERLFTDEFYLHYLKYTGKAGMSLYSIATALVTRPDVRAFFQECVTSTMALNERVNELLLVKGLLTKPPQIPYPDRVDFVRKQSYLNGFFGEVRPLQALEITHLYENVENNASSRAVLIAFSQVTGLEETRAYFRRGIELTS